MTFMTATEAKEQAELIAKQLGKTYGQLQNELFDPLVARAEEIIKGD